MARAEFPIQSVGRLPHQLLILPNNSALCHTNFLSGLWVSSFKTDLSHLRLAKLRYLKTFWHFSSSFWVSPITTISRHDILPTNFLLKSSTHAHWRDGLISRPAHTVQLKPLPSPSVAVSHLSVPSVVYMYRQSSICSRQSPPHLAREDG